MTTVTPEVLADLAPNGCLRAAINYGNPILAKRNPVTQAPTGVSVDMARQLASRLGAPVDFVTYDAAGKVVEGLQRNEWDVAFVARDPVRGKGIEQTFPYVIIEGAYLVREDSPIRSNEEVDQTGRIVVVGKGSAYDLFLTREITSATIVRSPTSPSVVNMMLAEGHDVAAGVKQQLQADVRRVPGLRMLDGRFMVIEQAMGTPKGREAGADFVKKFLYSMIESGFIASAIEAHGAGGALVASLPSGHGA
ncbi:ABC transporter substrate-binding protein [Paraburkholderia sediminicola]|uniref:ABC transporter substrate-binding protein n=1 Tax=Paraburkholderia sediminicola TaxID=458836 RepID=UPI0038B6D4CD